MTSLAELDVMVVDCQATAASPRGHLLEIGWGVAGPANLQTHARLIRLPDGERIPPAVARITGIAHGMMGDAIAESAAWRELADEASQLPQQPAPAVVHFARFERPFLARLGGGAPALDVVCTHDIARRLLPDLPRCSLRAVTGYFGRAVGALRRSAEHVAATAFIWRELVRLLEAQGVTTWSALHEWLSRPRRVPPRGRVWPMPRQLRLSAPDAPGVYRFLRTSGDVLYIGKASSLHHRVNSYFQKQHGVSERMLEMLSQVRAASFEVTPSALEAALLEADEIKHQRPPYNILLTADRHVWFARADLSERSAQPDARCEVGPFPSAQTLDQFTALATGDPAVLGGEPYGPPREMVDAAYARVCAVHPELCGNDEPHSRLLRLGTRLWREGRRDVEIASDDGWTLDSVQLSLERIALRAALARRRARWFTRLVDAAIVWREPGAAQARLLVVENGEIARREVAEPDALPPVPPGYRRTRAERRNAFTVARFDRLRVLTTELKRLIADGSPVSVRFGVAPPLAGARLAYALSWL